MMKTFLLVEDIHVQLRPDSMSPMEENAYIGQRFKLNGKRVEIVSNTGLTWTVRYLTIFEKFQEWWQKKLKKKLPILNPNFLIKNCKLCKNKGYVFLRVGHWIETEECKG